MKLRIWTVAVYQVARKNKRTTGGEEIGLVLYRQYTALATVVSIRGNKSEFIQSCIHN